MATGLSIGMLAAAAGVNIETIRYYQRRGLLDEPPKPLSGYRLYLPEQVKRLSTGEAKLLKGLQTALGDWHDHYQWCQKVQVEMDLLPLQTIWSDCAASALQRAELQLSEVVKLLPKSSGKKKAT
ncbi:MerR family DNA-binding transcriptional regulator [Pseudomonas sp. B1(2018)]|jgi:DNA-binding transcriptional MerR regulator|uniref:MerR family DNA-binding transcriptional regulator n=1 Tax=Pseudomonas sp. B1(2018) TaxID=2233856 RepID=UPI002113F997|nr:MerR family DNA-binding transcriptional regulator [Pseudomonas sp. B1(2018)]